MKTVYRFETAAEILDGFSHRIMSKDLFHSDVKDDTKVPALPETVYLLHRW
jgi:hypothetical protein